MASESGQKYAPSAPYRLTDDQLEAMAAAGVLGEDRVELLGGILAMLTQNPAHSYAVEEIAEAFGSILRAGQWTVRQEKPLVVDRLWRPQPDVVVLRGPRQHYSKRQAAPADVMLMVEVADASYTQDRGAKWARYAAAKVPVYWIADVKRRHVEVFTQPTGQGDAAEYELVADYNEYAEIPITIEGREQGRVAVRGIFA